MLQNVFPISITVCLSLLPFYVNLLQFRVVPYSFTITRALRTKAQIISSPRRETSVFLDIFFIITSACAQRAKLTVNFLAFPSVKFRKIWQIANKYFTLVGARFSGKSIGPVFCIGKRHKYEKIEKTAFTTPTFFVFRIRIPLDAICCENFGRFHQGNSRKLQIRP